jgi:hypothetical protein
MHSVTAVYLATLASDATLLRSLSGEAISDARALSLLGEFTGDMARARNWWSQAAKEYP